MSMWKSQVLMAWALLTEAVFLNTMILQMVRNECGKFGGHVDVEVSYKSLWLDVLIETQISQNLFWFE
jgi:hypothetical protein